MRDRFESLIRGLGKVPSFEFDEELGDRDLARVLLRSMGWALRGACMRLSFKRAEGLVMIGRGVRIRHPDRLTVGKNFVVEDYAEVMALSRHGIVCGNNVTVGAHAIISPSAYYGRDMGEGMQIGDNSNIGRYCCIGCSGFISIGRNVLMSPRVSLHAENHNFASTELPIRDQGVTREGIVIEDDCWIATHSIILAGVRIGHGSVVAAGSVVTKSVPPWSVVAGVPARIVSARGHGSVPNCG